MRFLVLGCNGMAGHLISLYLKEAGHTVLGYAKTQSKLIDSKIGDAFNVENLKKAVDEFAPDAIVNCIGILNDKANANKVSAVYLNSLLPHLLAQFTEATSIQVIHMSTDCVFSGKRGRYTETDFPDGQTFYDRTKALGELSDDKNVTLRNSIVGPDMNQNGIGLLNWFMQQKGPVKGYIKAIWTGQTTLQLAKTIEVVARRKTAGIINAVPEASISKYELLKLFNDNLRANQIEIIPSDDICVDKSLVKTRVDFNYTIPNYIEMIEELAYWMKDHRKLYPHYDIA